MYGFYECETRYMFAREVVDTVIAFRSSSVTRCARKLVPSRPIHLTHTVSFSRFVPLRC